MVRTGTNINANNFDITRIPLCSSAAHKKDQAVWQCEMNIFRAGFGHSGSAGRAIAVGSNS